MSGNRSYECEAVLHYFDTLIGGEPPTESDPRAVEHVAKCADCAAELERRAQLRNRLKAAVRSEAPSPGLEYRIRQQIRETERRTPTPWYWNRMMLRVAAMAAVCFGVWIAYQIGQIRIETASQEIVIRAMKLRVAGIFGVGLGDHLHCAWYRKFPKQPPSYDELLQKMGPEYSPLVPLVAARVPEDYRIIMAHRCTYSGRKFVHLALRADSKLASLVITRKQQGESFQQKGGLPNDLSGGVPLYRAGVSRFEVAGFESSGYLIYFVSDAGEKENLRLLASLAPEVRNFLNSLEG